MTRDDHERFIKATETLKNQPEFMQNINLIMLCKLDPMGIMEPMARTLAEYGIASEKIVPCIMDLSKIIANMDFDEKPRIEHLIK